MSLEDLRDALGDYFKWTKGSGGISDFLGQCSENEMPNFVVVTLESIKSKVESELPIEIEETNEGHED
jgi:putative ATP-dependent endonuclease of OLD family